MGSSVELGLGGFREGRGRSEDSSHHHISHHGLGTAVES